MNESINQYRGKLKGKERNEKYRTDRQTDKK
jgi:hypothetical protein